MARRFVLLVALAGCGGEPAVDGGADLAAGDLATAIDAAVVDAAPPDLVTPPDLAPPASWAARASGTTLALRALWVAGPGEAFVVGGYAEDGCAALHTVDGGATWQPRACNGLDWSAAWGADAAHLWVAGVGILFTGDLGTTWATQKQDGGWHGLWGSGANDVYAVGAFGDIAHAGDGMTFTAQASGVQSSLDAVWGSGAGDVYVAGQGGAILHSGDGGQSWNALASGTGHELFALWGSGPLDVFAVGDAGVILHSGDGGASWDAQDSGTQQTLFGVWGAGGAVYAVGFAGTIVRTVDGGAHWLPDASGTTRTLWAVAGSGPDEVFAVGDLGTILRRK